MRGVSVIFLVGLGVVLLYGAWSSSLSSTSPPPPPVVTTVTRSFDLGVAKVLPVEDLTGHKIRRQSITSDTVDFMSLSKKCTDKTSRHRYQELYARAFHGFRSTNATIKLLEVGLGCIYDLCAAGGAKTFMKFLPHASYHSLEWDVNTCKKKYTRSGVDKHLARFIDDHLCPGSSIDPGVLRRCNQRFGPFDVVIDDASHAHMHVTSAFRQWFSSSYLNPGAMYIVEDLQTVTLKSYDGTSEEPKNQSYRHPAVNGATFMNYAQNIFFCKLVGLFCFTPTRSLERHSMGVYAPMVKELVMARESALLRTHLGTQQASLPFASQDVIVALSQAEDAVFASPVKMLLLKTNGSTLSPSTELFLKAKFPNGIVDVEAGKNGNANFNDCFRNATASLCFADRIRLLRSNRVAIDLLWIETVAMEDPATWKEQRNLVEFIARVFESKLLKPHGVVAINGYQSRREANAAESAATHRRPVGEPLYHGDLKEPLLRMILDLSSSIMCCSFRYIRGEHARLPFQPQWKRVKKTRTFVGDISVDGRGTVYMRKAHPLIK